MFPLTFVSYYCVRYGEVVFFSTVIQQLSTIFSIPFVPAYSRHLTAPAQSAFSHMRVAGKVRALVLELAKII